MAGKGVAKRHCMTHLHRHHWNRQAAVLAGVAPKLARLTRCLLPSPAVCSYEDNGDAVNNLVVLVQKVGKGNIDELGSPDKFLADNAYLFGESASFQGERAPATGPQPSGEPACKAELLLLLPWEP